MKPILVASAAVFALGGSLLADAVNSATGTFSAFPSGFAASTPTWINDQTPPATPGAPFWNNPSDDPGPGGTHQMNIGDVLTDSGGLTGSTPVLGADIVTEQFTAAGGADPTAFDFVSTGNAFNLGLLFALSGLNTNNPSQGTTVFGYYVGSSYTQLYAVNNTSSLTDTEVIDPTTSGNDYGFYATVCYAPSECETYTTGDGNFGSVSGGAGWNHFALFQLASGNYALGFTAADAMVGENLGDFNDVVVELAAVPEPAAIATMALGLTALAIYKRRQA
jgi:hypothetical protein